MVPKKGCKTFLMLSRVSAASYIANIFTLYADAVMPGATMEKWNFVELPPLSPPNTIQTGSSILSNKKNGSHKTYKKLLQCRQANFLPTKLGLKAFSSLCLMAAKGFLSHSTRLHEDKILMYSAALLSLPQREIVSYSPDLKRWYAFV